ncbi:hypothetical protein BKA65DRAFT_549068 [Rhexocercosporidium sp. MPI-PUGE-AT-0058]|nr:hypothetical protein BKA65DRAFT_549068 [Rhexocercosporidium sp. MPI-PUGE-AT-0058]
MLLSSIISGAFRLPSLVSSIKTTLASLIYSQVNAPKAYLSCIVPATAKILKNFITRGPTGGRDPSINPKDAEIKCLTSTVAAFGTRIANLRRLTKEQDERIQNLENQNQYLSSKLLRLHKKGHSPTLS